MTKRLALLATILAAGCTVDVAPRVGVPGAELDDEDASPDVHPAVSGVCADGTTTLGVDVSYYDGVIDWTKAKAAGVQYAFIRVSDGTGFKDPKFTADWAGAQSAGVIRGAYQFFRPTENVAAQAQLLISAVGSYQPGDLPPVLDVEVTGGVRAATLQARIRTWVETVHAALGVNPIVYTGFYFWRDSVGGPSGYTQNPLWLAQYTTACPTVPSPWSKWTFWQYTDTGHVAGIPSDVDMNKFNGSLADLQAFVGAQVTDGGDGSDDGSAMGSDMSTGSDGSCDSPTLARSVPSGTCVESATDDLWERCNAGTWVTLGSSVGCTVTYGYCESATLGRAVPPRTCVQAKSDSEWYQCDGTSWVQPATSTSGPAGACSDSFPL
jgi:lysozyme